jgi:hypothetical protein
MEIITKVKNAKHAQKLLNSFDAQYNTKTWVFDATIADVDHVLLNDQYRNEPIMHLEECFEHFENNKFLTSDPLFVEDQKKDINDRKFHDLCWCYSVWQLTNSIKNEGMLHPLGIQRFHKDGFGAHPGTTRLRFHKYTQPQQVILTDYSGRNFAEDYPQFSPQSVKHAQLRNVKGLYHKISFMEDGRPKTLLQVSKEKKPWQCISSMWVINHNPSFLDPPISYELKDNYIYIAGDPVVVKQNGHWRVNQ